MELYGRFHATETPGWDDRNWVAYPTILSGDIGDARDNGDNSYHVVTGSSIDGSAVLDGFTITGGNADGCTDNGGGMVNVKGRPTLRNLIFSGNQAAGRGGGMYNEAKSRPALVNVTFINNTANYGGGMSNGDSSPTLTNITFSGNTADDNGGGMFNRNSSPTLTNCILWDNSPDQISGSRQAAVTYSDIQGGISGEGNIDADPLFVDAAAGDLRLLLTSQLKSPAIDAGDSEALPADVLDLDGDGDTEEPLPFDLDGKPRIVNGRVDMGAYEFQEGQ